MLKIKLVRIGKKNQPQYRIVVDEARVKNGGAVKDQLGYYNPLLSPAQFDLDTTKYAAWLAKGAKPTDTIRHLVNAANKPVKAQAKPKTKTKS